MEKNTQYTPEYPMKWHKFLIYFTLWAGAVLNGVNGALAMMGLTYGEYSGEVYAAFPKLEKLDVVYGAALVLFAVYGILTRFALARFKAKGPKMIVMLYTLLTAINLVYLILASAALGVPIGTMLDASMNSALITSLIMAVLNHVYYKKREELFVN